MLKKSVISLISYDAHLLCDSINSYYNYVDEIILGLDEDRITWSKNPFTFEENNLWKELKKIDIHNKISIIEHNFHMSNIPIENDNFERNFLKANCSNDWIFSFDADEVLVNPKEFFIDYLPIVEKYYNKLDLCFTWFLPYKEFENDYLVIVNNDGSFFTGDTQGFATSKDKTFTYCRWTENKRKVLSPLAVLHWSFCRKEHEVNQKINNFGHSDKTKNDPFFNTWKNITMENYGNLKNFKTSGMGENQWERLAAVPKHFIMKLAKDQCKHIKI